MTLLYVCLTKPLGSDSVQVKYNWIVLPNDALWNWDFFIWIKYKIQTRCSE